MRVLFTTPLRFYSIIIIIRIGLPILMALVALGCDRLSRPAPMIIMKASLSQMYTGTLELTSLDKVPELDPQSKLAILLKDTSLYSYFDIDETGIRLYQSPYQKQAGNPEIWLHPEEYAAFTNMCRRLDFQALKDMYLQKGVSKWPSTTLLAFSLPVKPPKKVPNSAKPLEGWRIALDPGHIAGSMEEAIAESKFVRVRATDRRPEVGFFEANLTLATALLIRERLEAMGATVLMTRTAPGVSSMGLRFHDWKRNPRGTESEEAAGMLTRATAGELTFSRRDRALYRNGFNNADLRNRADMVNTFQPHLTLIIHYNVDKANWEKSMGDDYFQPGSANYLMAFVPGSYSGSDLADLEHRIHFLRLLVSDDLERSMDLSHAFVQESQRITGVPIVKEENKVDYLDYACVLTQAPGVYARDLALTRTISGPLCYGESLCQDNKDELAFFGKQDMVVGGIPVSSRVLQVAESYISAVLRYRDLME